MNKNIEVIGVYPVEAEERCHLIELLIKTDRDAFDLGEFTQEIQGVARDNWQVPYDEYILNEKGTAGKLNDDMKSIRVNGSVRVVFFFHDLDIHRELITPFGNLVLPVESEKPERLNFITYEAPW